MPPKRKTKPKPKVPQRQKPTQSQAQAQAAQAQAVKQTVRVVVGETKKPRRPYRRRAKVAQPQPLPPMISPIPQVIQLPPQLPQQPFSFFSPEQFAPYIAHQINERLGVQPVLAEAIPLPPEGEITMSKPEREAPSLGQSQIDREFERIRREQQKEFSAIRIPPPRPPPGPPPTPPTPEIYPEMPQEMPPQKMLPKLPSPEIPPQMISEPKKRRERVRPPKATLEQTYFELTGEYPPKMDYWDLAKEITRLRNAPGTKMPG